MCCSKQMFPPTGGTGGLKGFSGAFSAMSDTVDQTSIAPTSEPPIPPARPSRHVQHAAQWTETKTLGPGLVMHSATATVSQWSEFQQSTEVFIGSSKFVRKFSNCWCSNFSFKISRSQFQTIRTQTVQSSSSSSSVLTPAQYLDDLQVSSGCLPSVDASYYSLAGFFAFDNTINGQVASNGVTWRTDRHAMITFAI